MKHYANWLIALLLPWCLAATACAAENPGYTEGTEYLRLSQPQPVSTPGKIEVVELFWYGCPHCHDLEPFVDKWLETKPDDVEFVRMPAVLGPRWEQLARAYYTAEVLGVLDKIHLPLFEAIHVNKRRFTSEEQIRAFFVEQGVSAQAFDDAFRSFAVSVKLNNAKLMSRRYALTGVPTVIVNGKFSTSGKYARGNENIMKVVDHLVVMERGDTGAADPG